jgi:hypothetical protein
MPRALKTVSRAFEAYHGHAGVQRCGDWCRHFEPLDPLRWDGFGRCVHPLSLRNGIVFSVRAECAVGEVFIEPVGDQGASSGASVK